MSEPLGKTAITSKFPIDCVGDHHEVYPLWKKRGIYQIDLVHLDQHPDFQWSHRKSSTELLDSESIAELEQKLSHQSVYSVTRPGRQGLHLGNYLCRVFQEKMVRKWYWVVPDPMWNSPYHRHDLFQDLKDLYRDRTGPMEPPEDHGTHFCTKLWAVSAWVGPLSALPELVDPVLLNIDLDFFTALDTADLPSLESMRWRSPWVWPETFLPNLMSKLKSIDSVAIAASVQGGFTPILLKFLQSGMASFFERSTFPPAYYAIQNGFKLIQDRKFNEAKNALESNVCSGPDEAARLGLLSHLHLESGDPQKAQSLYKEAAAYDGDFETPFACLGPTYEYQGRWQEAHLEYQRMKNLLPDAIWIPLAEARKLLSVRERHKAAAIYRDILKHHPDHPEALRHLGEIAFYYGNASEAKKLLQDALKLNSNEPLIHVGLASCALLEKKFEEARKQVRSAMRLGWHKPKVYWLLAESYFREGRIESIGEPLREWFRLHFLLLIYRLKHLMRTMTSL